MAKNGLSSPNDPKQNAMGEETTESAKTPRLNLMFAQAAEKKPMSGISQTARSTSKIQAKSAPSEMFIMVLTWIGNGGWCVVLWRECIAFRSRQQDSMLKELQEMTSAIETDFQRTDTHELMRDVLDRSA